MNNINSSSSINFKSHFTPQIRKIIQSSNVEFIEDAFDKKYGIDAKFNGNKDIATFFAMALNVFEELFNKYKLPFFALPPRIRSFSRESIIDSAFFSTNFCLPDSGYVLKNELPFELRSIFIQNRSGECINKETDKLFKNQQRSSSHFLSDTIHEWIHNIHLNSIYSKFGYEGECPYAKAIYQKLNPCGKHIIDNFENYTPDKQKRRQIYETLGAYSARSHSKLEIFAEGLTQAITGALDENLMITKNPLDGIVRFPGFLKKLIEDQLG